MTTIDSQDVRLFARSTTELGSTPDAAPAAESHFRHETPGSRAMRVSLARAFPVRTARLREALVSGSITKLARP